MPRPRIDRYWQERVRHLIENEPSLSPGAIARQLETEARKSGRTGWPKPRSVSRIVADHRKQSQEARQQYRLLSWPESMGTVDLPWEAAAAVLEMLVYLRKEGGPRPDNRLAKWFWRVTVAGPDAPIDKRLLMARLLTADEMLGGLASNKRPVEWFLAYAPWRTEASSAAYDEATTQTLPDPGGPEAIPRLEQRLQFPDSVPGLDEALDAIETFVPGMSGPVKEQLRLIVERLEQEQADKESTDEETR